MSSSRDQAVAEFTEAYIRRAPADYVETVGEPLLRAQAGNLFAFADARGVDPFDVRVFYPSEEVHGYTVPGSVIEIAADDSPFLIDSVTGELQDQGLEIDFMIHPVIGTSRDDDGRIVRIEHATKASHRESIQHYELSRLLDAVEAAALEETLRRIIRDVRRAVRDFPALQDRVGHMIELARSAGTRYDQEEIDDAVEFLRWLLDDHFVFLGYREYRIDATPEGPALALVPDSGLGILSDDRFSALREPVLMSEMPAHRRARYEEGFLLVVSKTNRTSTVHRRSRMDYVGLRVIGPDGEVAGEARMLGLFTSRAYMAEAAQVPLLDRKLEHIINAADLIEGSHDHKATVQLFNTFPMDELFATPEEDIASTVTGLLAVEERRQVRLFVRPDYLQRSVSLMVAMPRDIFNAERRRELQELFRERYDGASVDYRLALAESDHARLHFTVWIKGGEVPRVSREDLEREVLELCRTWEDRITELVAERVDLNAARELVQRWATHLPGYYKSSTSLHIAVGDVLQLERLTSGTEGLGIGLQNDVEADEVLTRLAVYSRKGKLDLSAILPVLEALGLRVVDEVPTQLKRIDEAIFIHDFGVRDLSGQPLDLDACGDRLAAAAKAALQGDAEYDSLDRLVVAAGLNHQKVAMLRAYRTFWRRVSPAFTVEYVNDALVRHPHIAAALVRLFEERFDPRRDGSGEEALRKEILEALDAVRSLDEDRILRGFLDLIGATLRTNTFRPGRTSLSFKFRSADVPDMPDPKPLFEIFVYAPDVEGIHLRAGMVARGGIRWSDRREDYRSEVLGLMKAQVTKNAIIVPTGAKGGFVVRRAPGDGEKIGDLAKAAYISFIRGLLDVTDNIVDGAVVHPPHVRIHDGEDPYLVVAADRGTASFSDTANAIADEYSFWLGDAFASGGSAGYDHKALGITAAGAWESVKRHFLDLGTDVTSEPIAVVGIGDMSGDVFGNGMLQSSQIRLVAAFDHRHVFIDPDPDPEKGFRERQRLYGLGGSSWDDYDRSLISDGGGVWARTEKRIELSNHARFAIGVEQESFTPDELIRALLIAPVDLLWNGGIGTYVKARSESNFDSADRTNDSVRVDGADLRCRVVGEGGNLGLTQLGRIEFSRGGGRINTDFVDNSGGVDCSDREVNLKILLRLAVEDGELDDDDRVALIADVASDVTDAVVYDNFLQAQILSQEIGPAASLLEAYEDLMVVLERDGGLDRTIEYLPTSEEMAERARTGHGLTRPELAVLLAYTKRYLRATLLASELADGPGFLPDLLEYFPEQAIDRFGHLAPLHRLRKEIIATVIANQVVNSQGITFVSRLMSQSGATAADVVRAYRIARELTEAADRWRAVEELDGRIDAALQAELLAGVDSLVEDVARWYLRHPVSGAMRDVIDAAKPQFDELADAIVDVGPPDWRAERDARVGALVAAGVPHDVGRRHVYQTELAHGPDILGLAADMNRTVIDVAKVFFIVGEVYEIDWLEAQAGALSTATKWQRWGVEALEDDLLLLRREMAEHVLAADGEASPAQAVGNYRRARKDGHARLADFLRTVQREGGDDLATLVVAVRQIRVLVG